jgi:hypothetical protein
MIDIQALLNHISEGWDGVTPIPWDREKINWELRQVMAACGRKSKKPAYISFESTLSVYAKFRYGLYARKHLYIYFYQKKPSKIVITSRAGRDRVTSLGDKSKDCWLVSDISRILYKIGRDPQFIAEHFEAISGHEQLELRHEMPRDLWPQVWLDEEANN